jgi:signal transduction histidine kinase
LNDPKALILKEAKKIYSITEHAEVYIDETGKLPVEEIIKKKNEFKSTGGEVLRYQPTESIIWIRFSIKNETKKKWFVELGSRHIDRITLFYFENDKEKSSVESGLHKPFSERAVKVNEVILPLNIQQGETQTYLMRLECKTTISIALTAGTLLSFYELNHRKDLLNGIYFGLIIALSLYNFFVFISIKDRAYLYYVLYITSLGLTIAFLRGYIIEIFNPTDPYTNIGNYFGATAFLFVVLFTRYFLLVDKYLKKIQWMNYIYFFLSGLCIITTAMGYSFIGFKVLMLEVVFMVPYVLLMGIKSWKAGIKVGRFYILGFGSFVVCDFIFILKENGVVPVNLFTEYSLLFGSSMEAIVLSFALAYKLNTFKKEKEQTQAMALAKANEFSKQLIKSQEDERKRIAAELHDSVGQSLSVIKNRTVLLQKDPSKPASIDEIGDIVTQTIEEVRNISYGLRPYQLDLLGLRQAIITLIEEVSDSTVISFSNEIDLVDGLLTKEAEINVYRIVQECLNNIVKHSEATEASITLQKKGQFIELLIEDNGKGLKETSVGKGFGLIGIKERANILHGEVAIQNMAPSGTSISILIPLL